MRQPGIEASWRVFRWRFTALGVVLALAACSGGGARPPADGGADGGSQPVVDGGCGPQGDGGAASSPTAKVGDPCWTGADCPAGGTCWTPIDGFPGGYCMIEGCTTSSCPEGSRCATFRDGVSRCVKTCTGNEQCRKAEGYQCSTSSICMPGDGTVPPGGSCGYDSDCMGGQNAYCDLSIGSVGGYCITASCTATSCPAGSKCVASVFEGGISGCLPSCQTDADCRSGFVCNSDSASSMYQICLPGCTAQRGCPGPFLCRPGQGGDEICIVGWCSASQPNGDCEAGQVCQGGACVAFACHDTQLEPNETVAAAQDLPRGDVCGFQVCSGDEDWYQFTPSAANTLFQVGISSNFLSGNLQGDLVLPDGNTRDLAWADPSWFQTGYLGGPSREELHSVLGAPGSQPHWLRVYGVDGAVNNYGIVSRQIPWVDGVPCSEAFSVAECRAQTESGASDPSKLFPFPLGNPADGFAGEAVFFKSALDDNGNGLTSTFRLNVRREVAMILRNAIHAVQQAFPGTGPLGIGDVSLPDGSTPEGHPNYTHYEGANLDIAYFIQPDKQHGWGNLAYRSICCDRNRVDYIACVDQRSSSQEWGTCLAGSQNTHIVDLPRTALFVAKVAGSGRLRVVGVEAKVRPGLLTALETLVSENKVTAEEQSAAASLMATAEDDSSWVWHFNHMHASFCTGECGARMLPSKGLWPSMPRAEQASRVRQFYERYVRQ